MSYRPFNNARLKLRRGRRHISEFEAEIASFLAREPYQIILSESRISPPRIEYHWTTHTHEAPPEELAMILGDAVHNLRVALDVLANDTVALGGNIPKGVYFPFAKDAADLEKQIKEKMKGATPEAKEFVRTLKPYKGGNEPLRALHDLDIQDKHISPLQVSHSQTSAPGRVGNDGVEWQYEPIQTLPDWYTPPPGDKVLGLVRWDHEAVFEKGLPYAGKPVIGTLNDLAQLVDGVIQTFEAHFL